MTSLRSSRRLVSVVCAVSLVFSLTVSKAWAEDLAGEQQSAQAKVSQEQSDVNSANQALADADTRVNNAQAAVVAAQQQLQAAQKAWEDAQAVQAQKAIELFNANQALDAAKAAVQDGQNKIDAQKDAINAYARSVVQDSLPLVSVAILINTSSTASLADRVQWNDTVLATNQIDLDNLRTLQQQLLDDQQKAAEAQAAADLAGKAAEAQVEVAQAAHDAAEQAEQAVETALANEQSARDQAASILAQHQDLLAQAQAEVDQVNAKIAEQAREEEEQREAAEKARQDELAREQAAAAAAASQTPAASAPVVTPPSAPVNTAGHLSSSQAQSVAYGMMSSFGWSDSQFQCLVYLWNQESGWRWSATNPSSGAYGIPQSLPASKMASVGADWHDNAVTQIVWGLNYIAGRYGSPCGAWSHETSYWWY